MFYEEAMIDGALHWRGTPNGKWEPCRPARLNALIAELRAEQAATALQGSGGEVVDLIVRDCCEADRPDCDDPDAVCVRVDHLRQIVERHLASPAQPSGFVLVPVEPTAEMLRAGGCVEPPDSQWQNYIEAKGARLCWALMLTAAPAPIEQEG